MIRNVSQNNQCDGSLKQIDNCVFNMIYTKYKDPVKVEAIDKNKDVICAGCKLFFRPSDDLKSCQKCRQEGCSHCDAKDNCLSRFIGHDEGFENGHEDLLKNCYIYTPNVVSNKPKCLICSENSVMVDNKCMKLSEVSFPRPERCNKYSKNVCIICNEGFSMLESGVCYSVEEFKEIFKEKVLSITYI